MYCRETVEIALRALDEGAMTREAGALVGVSPAPPNLPLGAWMRWFRSGRISQALGWLTPDEHRLALGYAV